MRTSLIIKLRRHNRVYCWLHSMREMAESDRSTPSLVTNNELVCSTSDSLSSNLSDEDGFPLLSHGGEMLPYQYEPYSSPDDSSYACVLSREESLHHSQI